MAITMMVVSAVISIVFLVDFTKTILELHRERINWDDIDREPGGFSV